jgi:hypothetical protein
LFKSIKIYIEMGGCLSLLQATDIYGDGINAFFKVEYFDSVDADRVRYYPASYGLQGNTIGLFDLDGPSEGARAKVSVVPALKASFNPCDVGVNAEAEDCNVINEPWELSWVVRELPQVLLTSTPSNTFYGDVNSILELRCDPKFGSIFGPSAPLSASTRKLADPSYVSPGTSLEFINLVPLVDENIATKPSAKPRSEEYDGPRPMCKGIKLDLVDKSGDGWFRHERSTYSEYIVSSNNKVVVRGTMEKPAFHDIVEVGAGHAINY